jgi:signal transduction histidine kinase
LGTLGEAFRACSDLLERAAGVPEVADAVAEVRHLWEANDCEFLMEEIPEAITETLEGTRRVAEIVRAMKDFAHPGWDSKSPVDLNQVIRTTVEVSRNEWKYAAELDLDLDEELPQIAALAGPLGQSILIMIVNSAQALQEQGAGKEADKGRIRIDTARHGDHVEMRIADTGPGIPEDIRGRIFDPFFTTKEVGKGSGQGLSIAHSIIVDKHAGEIQVESGDPGAVFVVRLPIEDHAPDSADLSAVTTA